MSKLSKKTWIDGFSHWQFRTFKSRRIFQICFINENYQGDWLFSIIVHCFFKAAAFDYPNLLKKKIDWRLFEKQKL